MELMKSALKRGFPRTYNRLRECKYAMTSRMFSPYTVKHTYGGHGFEVHIADSLARGWYDRDWERLDEINMLGANGLRGGCLVFDLGAHQNVVAMMWAKEVGPSGTVISVEASRHNFEVGRRNVSLNGFANIITLHAVVAETEGQELFFIDFEWLRVERRRGVPGETGAGDHHRRLGEGIRAARYFVSGH